MASSSRFIRVVGKRSSITMTISISDPLTSRPVLLSDRGTSWAMLWTISPAMKKQACKPFHPRIESQISPSECADGQALGKPAGPPQEKFISAYGIMNLGAGKGPLILNQLNNLSFHGSPEKRPRKKSKIRTPFMVRYLTTNGKSDTYAPFHPFALRYGSIPHHNRQNRSS